MDASILKYMAFVQTIECGSFTRAAELLNYSQSGISRMIGDLEKDWRVSLLVRNRTGVTLTSEGMRLLPYARSVCEEYRKLQMQVEELNGCNRA
ncbi:MAG: LysR family transcriptional regulator [Acutalibacteraceae bacterium]